MARRHRTADERGYVYRPEKVAEAAPRFPVAEVFGYPPEAATEEAVAARDRCWCPFRDGPCLKVDSPAKTGICSIRYRAEGFQDGIWAVCAHRLSGDPFGRVLEHHFGANSKDAELVTEVRIKDPTMSFDGVGVLVVDEDNVDFVGIEAQTIDSRGGALKPLWDAYVAGEPDTWAARYGKRPTFGVNTTNVWKRLIPQVMNKGRLYAEWDSELYVLLQSSVFEFIKRRMGSRWRELTIQERPGAEIIWVPWDYTGETDPKTGRLLTAMNEPTFTTVAQVEEAFLTINAAQRPVFIGMVLKKLSRDRQRQVRELKRRVAEEAAAVQQELGISDAEADETLPPEK